MIGYYITFVTEEGTIKQGSVYPTKSHYFLARWKAAKNAFQQGIYQAVILNRVLVDVEEQEQHTAIEEACYKSKLPILEINVKAKND